MTRWQLWAQIGVHGEVNFIRRVPKEHRLTRNVGIRGNASYMRVWRWLADLTTYGLLFLTMSGVYLWAVLRAERQVGLSLLCAGAISFFGLIYAIAR